RLFRQLQRPQGRVRAAHVGASLERRALEKLRRCARRFRCDAHRTRRRQRRARGFRTSARPTAAAAHRKSRRRARAEEGRRGARTLNRRPTRVSAAGAYFNSAGVGSHSAVPTSPIVGGAVFASSLSSTHCTCSALLVPPVRTIVSSVCARAFGSQVGPVTTGCGALAEGSVSAAAAGVDDANAATLAATPNTPASAPERRML